jgi:RNA polymerase sigma-32 factor
MYRAAPSLSRQEIHEILIHRATDTTATARIVGAMTRLVVRWASVYLPVGILPIDDLVQEGMVGLLRAIETYDIERPVSSFHTLAWFFVRRQCSDAIRQNRRAVSVGWTRSDRDAIRGKVSRAERELRLLNGSATREEIAEHIGVDIADVESVLFRYGNDFSFDAPLVLSGEESDLTLHTLISSDAPPPDELCCEKERAVRLTAIVDEIAATCTATEREMLFTRILGEPDETFDEAGARYNVSRQRMQQIDSRVRARLIERVLDQMEG